MPKMDLGWKILVFEKNKYVVKEICRTKKSMYESVKFYKTKYKEVKAEFFVKCWEVESSKSVTFLIKCHYFVTFNKTILERRFKNGKRN